MGFDTSDRAAGVVKMKLNSQTCTTTIIMRISNVKAKTVAPKYRVTLGLTMMRLQESPDNALRTVSNNRAFTIRYAINASKQLEPYLCKTLN